MKRKHLHGILTVVSILFLSLPFFCRGSGAAELPLWELGLGGTLLVTPDYRGSDEVRVYPLPFPYVIYRGDLFKVERERVRSLLFQSDRFLLDISLGGSVPVNSGRNSAREGMPDLDPTFEIGPSLEIILAGHRNKGYKFTLTIPVRAVFATDFTYATNIGWTFNPRLNFDKYDIWPGRGWHFGLALGPMVADRAYHDYFYTVDAAYATPQRQAYSAPGGYSGAICSASLRKYFTNLWVSAYVMLDVLQGASFRDSPLVRTNVSLMGGVAMAWIFTRSATRVDADP